MLKYVHSRSWRQRFASIDRALRTVERRPAVFDDAVLRWSAQESTLGSLTASELFRAPNQLSEPQARALIRTSRTDDPDANLAAWTLIYQFINPMISAAEAAERRYGHPLDESVETAIADLFTSIHHINLDTNVASIFFALSRMMTRAVLSQRARLLDPATFVPYMGECDDFDQQITDAPDIDLIDWQCTLDSLTDFLADDMVDALGWNRENRYFARRQARLRAFVACRVSEAATGDHSSAPAIAAQLGESADMIKELQAAVNKVWSSRQDHYCEAVSDLLGQAA